MAPALRVSLLLGVAVPAVAAAMGHGLWLEARPEGAAESEIHDAVAAARKDARADSLFRISGRNPGTSASGLAQLAAGLILAENGKPAEAIAPLTHPDISRTAIAERALLALARALGETRDEAGAAHAYVAAAAARSDGPAACGALLSAADAFQHASQHDKAIETLERALAACPQRRAEALLALAKAYVAKGDTRAAALAYDRLDREQPLSAEARESSARLRALAAYLPPTSTEERAARGLKKGLGLLDAGRNAEAIAALRALPMSALSSGEADLVRVRLGRALLAGGKVRDAELALLAVRSGSAYEAEAAYHLAKLQERRTQKPSAYESVLASFPGSEWAEEALLALANHYQKDKLDEQALPYYRRLLDGYPEGRYLERATWRVGWGDYRASRFEQAAAEMEKTARLRPRANLTPGLLYWSGRARKELGQVERAVTLFDETYRRYKHAYHGIRAREALAQLPAGPYTPPVTSETTAEPEEPPAPARERIRQLLLLERFDEADEELRALPASSLTQGTLAWVEWKRGRLRPAITAMKRAYPEYIGEAGDLLPAEAWRILYPLEYADLLRAKAVEGGLDPALIAALVCQESTFDADAVSVAGARGLMQIMPPTGRTLARSLGVAYQRQALHRPETSLDFGTRYLRDLMDRYGGRVERALAAYNAGPHRVDAWTAAQPEMPAEEFIESIPFTETRFYVMTILAMQEQYRRIYALSAESRTASDAR